MKSLGEQVQEFMAGEGLNAPEMGRLVGRSRQNIENLVAGTVRNPSYLPELVRVMRTSADVLLSGRYVYRPAGAVTPAPEPQPAAEPWPLDPYISRERWALLSQAVRHAAAWEASKVVRLMSDVAELPPGVPSIAPRDKPWSAREMTNPANKNRNTSRKEQT